MQPGKRIRGRKGQELRKQRLAREPLCRHCREKGFIREATTPDHIVPIAYGGTDTEDNIQCLCADCHAIKTAKEGAAHGGASTHPDWLKPSGIPLTIVCGPPCSGKTTYVKEHAKAFDTIIDIDAIALDIDPTYKPWSGMLKGELITKALRVRNAMLGSLHHQTRGNAWFIVSAPAKAERDWWQQKLGGNLILIDTPADECKRRAVARGTPKAIDGIDQWFRRSKQPWKPKAPKPEFNSDGRVIW
jgi:5-methylcytosine-specific restriction protein A